MRGTGHLGRAAFTGRPLWAASVVALAALLLVAWWYGGPAEAAPPPVQAGATLRVAIKPLDPFVIRRENHYSGFSIELWDEIARRNGWRTDYVWFETLPPLLEEVSAGKADVGIAGISITREREARLDFSYPMFNAGLQVLTPQRSESSVVGTLWRFISGSLGLYLAGLAFTIFQREDYGIAMPTGSPLRKAINESLLEMQSDGTYARISEHYFGRATQ